jgi:sn-glycerol 3-phosphate transport system substrate-binding protein
LAFIEENAEFDWGVGFLPGGNGPGAPIGGGNFYIFQDTTDEEREAALDFIKFMSSPASAAKWSIATGYVAPRPDTWETPEMLAYAERLPQFATFQRAKVTQYLVDAIESVVTGNAEPAEALRQAQEGADSVLGEYQ